MTQVAEKFQLQILTLTRKLGSINMEIIRINGPQPTALSTDVDSDASFDVQVLCSVPTTGNVFKRTLPQPSTE